MFVLLLVRLEPPAAPREAVSPPGRHRAQQREREPPRRRLRGSIDLVGSPYCTTLAAAAARAWRGAGPPGCSRKAARGGVATLGAELRALKSKLEVFSLVARFFLGIVEVLGGGRRRSGGCNAAECVLTRSGLCKKKSRVR